MGWSVPSSALRASAFLVLAVAFAMHAVGFGLSVPGVVDQAHTYAGTDAVLSADAEFKGTSSSMAPRPPSNVARHAIDDFAGLLVPLGLLALGWAAVASLGEPAAERLFIAFVVGAGAAVFSFIARPLIALLVPGHGNHLGSIPFTLAFGAGVALAVSVAGARTPVVTALLASGASTANHVLYAVLPRAWDSWLEYAAWHALPLVAGWLSAALYAGAFMAAVVVELRREEAARRRVAARSTSA